eukprot:741853_1
MSPLHHNIYCFIGWTLFFIFTVKCTIAEINDNNQSCDVTITMLRNEIQILQQQLAECQNNLSQSRDTLINDNSILKSETMTFSLVGIYSIHGYYNDVNEQYLSYHASSGFCRQIYNNPTDSQFEFIAYNKEQGLYYIVNRYNDRRKDLWLGYGERDAYNGNMVGLYEENMRSLWKLIPVDDTKKSFKILCFNYEPFCGWLSYQYDGKWNKLYNDEHDAAIY